jgi:hypothetical protein
MSNKILTTSTNTIAYNEIILETIIKIMARNSTWLNINKQSFK